MILLRTADFLRWLDGRGRVLHECAQGDIDAWFAEHRGRAWMTNPAVVFLRWATDQQEIRRLVFTVVEAERRAPLGQAQRIALVRDLLTADKLPLLERVVALLVLLYAQPISRIVRLTVHDVLREDGRVAIRLGDPPSPVPEPFATLLLRFIDTRPNTSTPANQASAWLIPGQNAGEPMTAARVRKRLRALSIPTHQARTAAFRQLVLQAPASVVADMLGYHPVHAAFITRQAGAEWSRYAAGDHSRTPHIKR